jgi:hypothetical protein
MSSGVSGSGWFRQHAGTAEAAATDEEVLPGDLVRPDSVLNGSVHNCSSVC